MFYHCKAQRRPVSGLLRIMRKISITLQKTNEMKDGKDALPR